MALSFSLLPLEEPRTWERENWHKSTHERTMVVTGFVASTYYPMIVELHADPGLPVVGASTPNADPFFDALKLRSWGISEVICNPAAPAILLRLSYSSQFSIITSTIADKDGPVVFRTRSLARQIETQFDRNGAVMKTLRNGESQVKTYFKQKSLMVYELERLEDANPEGRAAPLLDKVNATTWNGRGPRTVLFSEFSADTRDNGETYQCFYSFLYNPDTHDPLLPHLLPIGIPPADLPALPADNTALIQPEVDDQASFSPLNITI